MIALLLLLQVAPAHYRHAGAWLLPDSVVTPGAVETADTAIVCHRTTTALRHVTPAMHKTIFAAYGIPYAQHAKYEDDHLISLELGGVNDNANRWPQPYPDAYSKDSVENLALPAGVIGQGVGTAVKAGIPLTIGQGMGLLAKGAAAGAIPAGIAGFSAGGADPGDIPARVDAAKRAAAIGALLGTIGTGVGIKLTRGHVERAADLANKGVQRQLAISRLAESQARLAKMQNVSPVPAIPIGETPEGLAARARWSGGRTPPPESPTGLLGAPGPSAPMPGNPQGLLGPEGISPAPKASYPPTLTEMQGFSSEPRSPLLPTDAEAATTAAAKALKIRAREAARNAYNLAITAGQTVAYAKAAAQRAAAMIGLLAP